MTCFDAAARAADETPDAPDGVMQMSVCGVDVLAVLLPSDLLTEERVSRMNDFWDLLDQREVLVVAVSASSEHR